MIIQITDLLFLCFLSGKSFGSKNFHLIVWFNMHRYWFNCVLKYNLQKYYNLYKLKVCSCFFGLLKCKKFKEPIDIKYKHFVTLLQLYNLV